MSSYDPYKEGDPSSSRRDMSENNNSNAQSDNNNFSINATNQNDTFLSRIFGLNSIYNQLQENYQYYDPEFESTYQQQQQVRSQITNEEEGPVGGREEDDESLLPKSSQIPIIENNEDISKKKGAGSLLDSESDSDLSSSEEGSYIRPNQADLEQVIPPKERALYLWANITNMDEFLSDVYYYYRGKGIVNIVLTRVIDLLILVFILFFTVFVKWGVNYDLFMESMGKEGKHMTLSDLIIPGYLSQVPLVVKFFLFGFGLYVVLRVIQTYFDYNYKLKEVRNFYYYLLNVTDEELMTISWKTIVEKLMLLKDYNTLTSTQVVENHDINDLSSKVRLNAHDIANRIMRRENYMIALINKDLFDLNLFNLPFINSQSVLTRTLEWNLKLCIDNFIYTPQGQINPQILKDYNRNQMAPLEWRSKLQLSIGPANTYINQFPRGFLAINISKLINFVAGAIMAILVIMGVWFEDESHSFWSFEITEGRSTLFYISIFGTIWAITSSSTPNVNNESGHSFVYDPEASLRYVSQFTHYLPSRWNKKLHTIEVKNEFCDLYSLKIIIILNEIFSLVLTPFILWFKVSASSGAIIDFFREYSIHVDGLGYVCYFAMFNFEEKDKNMMSDLNKRKKTKKQQKRRKKNKQRIQDSTNSVELNKLSKSDDNGSSSEESDDSVNYLSYQQDDKMIKSYMYFLESYGGTKAPQPQSRMKSKSRTPNQPQSLARPVVHAEPSPSFLYEQQQYQDQDQDQLGDSFNNFHYGFEDSGLLRDDVATGSRKKPPQNPYELVKIFVS
ncbi:ATG9 [[Candida] subhashii]|uniref:Autophagy-related protein 9 n=1 Tax=[Candida] subhashii TaxID=561895 RepID=A0A8J5QDK6_9ASCO|nr:ATG9 [[Candida] subhashii]KAG7660504.1 ATG9 [[Candida] subhashii]